MIVEHSQKQHFLCEQAINSEELTLDFALYIDIF